MHYIFDMDGTLIDSTPAYGEATINFLKENKVEYPSNVVEIITPLGYEGAARYFQSLGIDIPLDELLEGMKQSLLDQYLYHIPAKAAVIETLHRLHRAGHKLHVLTASPHMLLDPCLKRLAIYDLFENVWSSDDFKLKKSQKGIYLAVANKLGIPAGNCIFVDDNIGSITAAKNAGMHTVGVYDSATKEREPAMRQTADQYIYTFAEL